MKRKRGFTLIELMIVIAIIAILAAVLVPNFMRVRRSAQMNACLSNVKNIGTAVEAFSVDSGGAYPDPAKDMATLASNYVGKPLYCPSKRGYYVYSLASDLVTYTVSCPAGDGAGPTANAGFAVNGVRILEGTTDPNTGDTIIETSNWSKIFPGADGSWPTLTFVTADNAAHKANIQGTSYKVYPAVNAKLGTGLILENES